MTKFHKTLLSLFFMALMGCEQTMPPPPLQKITLGVAQQPTSVLVYVAAEQKFFEKYGLDVELKSYLSGKRALDEGLLANETDIISVTELPIALTASFHPELRILSSSVVANDINRICARRDAAINQSTDLQGKKIATQANSAMHYFLHQFLLEQGIMESDVNMTFMKIEELVPAIVDGRVQAISAREPQLAQCQQQLGDKSITFSAKGLYEQYDLLVSSAKFTTQHPQHVQALLKAMLDAENYAKAHPTETLNILAQGLGISPEIAATMWSQFSFRIQLPQALLSILEDEVRWGIETNIINGDVPDFTPLFFSETLRVIAPERVSLIP